MMQNTKPDQDFEHLKLSMESWFSQYKYQNYLQNLDWGLNVKVCIKFRGLWAQLSASELSSISISSLSPAVNHLMTYTLYRALIFIRKRRSATRITLKKTSRTTDEQPGQAHAVKKQTCRQQDEL